MTTRAQIRTALAALVTSATTLPCGFGIPRDVPSGDDTWLELSSKADYEPDESGGHTVRTATFAIVTINTVTGAKGGPTVPLQVVEARVELIKDALEADVKLGGIVMEARIVLDRCEPVPASENAWAAGARIEIEVDEW